MELTYAPLFSGSSGNSVYVGCEQGQLLVDAGVSGRRIEKALASLGLQAGNLDGICVTHEHHDHINAVGILSRKYDLPVYATRGTWEGMADKVGPIALKNMRIIEPGQEFGIGSLGVLPFPTPHDAREPVGFSFSRSTARFTVATDIGYVNNEWLKYVLGSDAVLLEANYDPDMLQAGPYPYELKKRILSRRGHLSNDDSGSAAVRLIDGGTHQIILGHLSKENNFPQLALKSVASVLYGEGIDPEDGLDLRVAQRDEVTGLFHLRTEWT